MRLCFYYVKTNYNRYLIQFDNRIMYSLKEKANRPYVGVLIEKENDIYLAPLTSPKEKHQKMKTGEDFVKIETGLLGAINLNNMIPVPKEEVIKIEIKKIKNRRYANILKRQLYWCRLHESEIIEKAQKLYKKSTKDENIKTRCCNFEWIEKKCEEYKIRENDVVYWCA